MHSIRKNAGLFLELKLHREPQNALRISIRQRIDLTKAQHRVIEYVERLNIDLQRKAFFDRKQPVHRHVQTPAILRTDEVAWSIPQGQRRFSLIVSSFAD
jgi:hypothetical protein